MSAMGHVPGPDFLCIGAPRAGTTWLYQMLRAHPGIWLPPIKELKYFDRDLTARTSWLQRLSGPDEGNRIWRRHLRDRLEETVLAPWLFGSGGMVAWWVNGQRRLGDGRWQERWTELRRNPGEVLSRFRWDLRYFLQAPSDTWYGSLFRPAGERITGDISPSYMRLDPVRVSRIYRLLPEAKLIFLMRHPVERVWASVRMAWGLGKLRCSLEDEDALLRFSRREATAARSRYCQALKTWESYYPPHQWFIAFYEELSECPEDLLLRLYRFLGVEASARHIPTQVRQKVLAAPERLMPRAYAVEMTREYHDELQELARRFGGYATRWLEAAEALLAQHG